MVERERDRTKKQVDALFIYSLSLSLSAYPSVFMYMYETTHGLRFEAHHHKRISQALYAFLTWRLTYTLYVYCIAGISNSMNVYVKRSEVKCIGVCMCVCMYETYKTQSINITGYYRNRIRRKIRCYMSRTLSMVLVASQQLPSYILFA